MKRSKREYVGAMGKDKRNNKNNLKINCKDIKIGNYGVRD
jgi:hypothetical protein